jgi:TRAP-type C4-dicarboxylate transport system permease small subunit
MLLLLIVVSIVISIVARAVFNAPFTWTVELATILVIWSVYLPFGLNYRDRTHLSISVFADRLPPKMRAALDVATDILLVIVLAIMLTSCWTAMRMNYGMTTMALDVSVSLAYYLAAGVGALSMLGYIAAKYRQKLRAGGAG